LVCLGLNLFYYNFRLSLISPEHWSLVAALFDNVYLTNMTHDAIIIYYAICVYYDIKYMCQGNNGIKDIRYP